MAATQKGKDAEREREVVGKRKLPLAGLPKGNGGVKELLSKVASPFREVQPAPVIPAVER